MIIDDAATERLFAGATLSAEEATALSQIGDLAAGVDLSDDADEHDAYDALKRRACTIAGIDPAKVPVVSPLPVDDEERMTWVTKLCGRLTSARAKDLAFSVAYLVIVSDLELAPAESDLLDDLVRSLGFEDDHVRELSSTVGELVTPS